jgi:hypothetical protein
MVWRLMTTLATSGGLGSFHVRRRSVLRGGKKRAPLIRASSRGGVASPTLDWVNDWKEKIYRKRMQAKGALQARPAGNPCGAKIISGPLSDFQNNTKLRPVFSVRQCLLRQNAAWKFDTHRDSLNAASAAILYNEMNSTPPHRVGSRGVLSARSWSTDECI